MAGRDVYVERVLNGARVVVAEARMPVGSRYVVLSEDDHIHFVLGSEEDLAGVGLEPAVEAVAPEPKPAPKPRKRTAAKK